MTRDDIIAMAREAGMALGFTQGIAVMNHENLERLVTIVEDAQSKRMFEEGMVTVGHMRQQIAAEREAIIQRIPGGHSVDPQWVCDMIRARGQA